MHLETNHERLLVYKKNQVLYLYHSEVLFIERINKQTIVHTTHGEFAVNLPLKSFEEVLPDTFVRAHKSYIVNKVKLRELNLFNKNTYEALFPNRKTALVNKDCISVLI